MCFERSLLKVVFLQSLTMTLTATLSKKRGHCPEGHCLHSRMGHTLTSLKSIFIIFEIDSTRRTQEPSCPRIPLIFRAVSICTAMRVTTRCDSRIPWGYFACNPH